MNECYTSFTFAPLPARPNILRAALLLSWKLLLIPYGRHSHDVAMEKEVPAEYDWYNTFLKKMGVKKEG
jgi:hypothetical protein